jgi:hypothetical protein
MRTFSLHEAQEMLPVLESLLRSAIRSRRVAEEIDNEAQELQARIFINGGTLVNVRKAARRKAEREKALQNAKDALDEISAIGVQVKDLDTGLLDFPCRVEGEVVLLCWKLGERSIAYWHGLTEGFAGRKPIDQRIANAPGSETRE